MNYDQGDVHVGAGTRFSMFVDSKFVDCPFSINVGGVLVSNDPRLSVVPERLPAVGLLVVVVMVLHLPLPLPQCSGAS